MYIMTTLAEPGSGCNFQPPFSSAERNITETDAPHIFRILGGPSPWQRYLQGNLAAHKDDLPARPMRIVTEAEFARRYNGVFGQQPPAHAQGFVDRGNAMIFLREFPVRNFNQTKAGLALHEAVHLFSHPPGRSNRMRATAFGLLEEGLLEGLTQIVTEDIQAAQCIRPLRADWQAYKEYIPVTRRFMQVFTPAVVAEAYFNGIVTPLINAITQRWTVDAFRPIRQLTNQKKPQQALQAIETLEQAFRRRQIEDKLQLQSTMFEVTGRLVRNELLRTNGKVSKKLEPFLLTASAPDFNIPYRQAKLGRRFAQEMLSERLARQIIQSEASEAHLTRLGKLLGRYAEVLQERDSGFKRLVEQEQKKTAPATKKP